MDKIKINIGVFFNFQFFENFIFTFRYLPLGLKNYFSNIGTSNLLQSYFSRKNYKSYTAELVFNFQRQNIDITNPKKIVMI